MHLKTLGGLAFALCAAIFAPSASAGFILGEFTVEAEGTATLDGADIDVLADVVDQDPALGFTSLEAILTVGVAGGGATPISGSFTLFGDDGDLFATADGSLFGLGEPFITTAGTFTITGGTGIFASLTGSGVFSSFTDIATGATQVKLGGVLVPAPGSLAMIGAAGLIAIPRRRRAG